MTPSRPKTQGIPVKHWMLKPKCHPIYINTALNSIFTVLRNIYQNFLLCAMKFHCHARSLPHQDQKFLTGAVFDILNFGYTLLRNRVVSPMSKSFQLECNVKELEVLWSPCVLHRSLEKANKLSDCAENVREDPPR
ncbi:hypothetical protein BC936DRAFT_146596 [Jimgerdemannia flammicorona]|uniref:Telomerase reverse transcriptase n=1 Tax=Jimgerdemannia flammicorona TaxID=994334 RepID=A0A433D772_9FUNG|nr:hypothetical protein BC936DRAFT_146596 [Jimgerdemannia flammicorona]